MDPDIMNTSPPSTVTCRRLCSDGGSGVAMSDPGFGVELQKYLDKHTDGYFVYNSDGRHVLHQPGRGLPLSKEIVRREALVSGNVCHILASPRRIGRANDGNSARGCHGPLMRVQTSLEG